MIYFGDLFIYFFYKVLYMYDFFMTMLQYRQIPDGCIFIL